MALDHKRGIPLAAVAILVVAFVALYELIIG
jgi:hypothetical protein